MRILDRLVKRLGLRSSLVPPYHTEVRTGNRSFFVSYPSGAHTAVETVAHILTDHFLEGDEEKADSIMVLDANNEVVFRLARNALGLWEFR